MLRHLFQSSPGFGAGRYWCVRVISLSSKLFQSSPGFGAGRYCYFIDGTVGFATFQSSPGFGAGRYEFPLKRVFRYLSFNPRPALGPGATKIIGSFDFLTSVSILARLWGRALQHRLAADTFPRQFQSSPGFGAGRYTPSGADIDKDAGFNPRPALGPGATSQPLFGTRQTKVSILARLWGRALHRYLSNLARSYKVSILARLWGRALPQSSAK